MKPNKTKKTHLKHFETQPSCAEIWPFVPPILLLSFTYLFKQIQHPSSIQLGRKPNMSHPITAWAVRADRDWDDHSCEALGWPMDLGVWLICSEFNFSVINRVYECMPKMAKCLDLYGYNPSNVFLFPKTKKKHRMWNRHTTTTTAASRNFWCDASTTSCWVQRCRGHQMGGFLNLRYPKMDDLQCNGV